ncbi:MAG: hypothetical protein KBT11_10920 [Treponema sp.]|nr:hypothetical protein [Candidatus Treponema equifaecale]
MTSGQKVASSLLISVLCFSLFTVLAFSGLFDLVEVNYYQPVAKQIKEQKLQEIEEAQNEYLEILTTRFDNFAKNGDVKTYANLRPSDASVQNRERIRAELLMNTQALQGIRIVDSNGRNLYFSTYEADKIKNAKTGAITYKNYNTLGELPFDSVKSVQEISENASPEMKTRIIRESKSSRLIFSLPFYDAKSVQKGTIIFYCDAGHLNRYLFSRNLIDMSGFGVLLAENPAENSSGVGGFVFGMPNIGQKSLEDQILLKWKTEPETNFWRIIPETENETDGKAENSENQDSADKKSEILKSLLTIITGNENPAPNSLCVFSHKNENFGYIAAIYGEDELKFPPYLRLLLLAATFITFYLIIFLLFSFKRDDLVVIRGRVASFQKQFLKQYKKRSDVENDKDLPNHRKFLEDRIKKSLGKLAVKYSSEVDTLIAKSWNEILIDLGKNYAVADEDSIVVNRNELREMLEDILGSGKLKVQTVQAVAVQQIESPAAVAEASGEETVAVVEESVPVEESPVVEETPDAVEKAETVEEVEAAEELDEIEDAETVEELDEIEDAESAEELDEIEEAEPAEELDEVEEAEPAEELDEVEDVEAAEELDEVEEAEPAEELDEVEEAESVEELDEVEEAESVEELDEVDDAESVEELGEVEDAEPAEELDEVEEAESAEELDEVEEAEPAEELDEVEDAEPAEEVDEVEEAEPAEELDEVEEAEAAEELDEVEDAEPAEELDEVEDVEAAEEVDEVEEAEPAEELDVTEDFEEVTDGFISEADEEKVLDDELLHEDLVFGVPESEQKSENASNEIVDNFEIGAIDYGFLDETETENSEYDEPGVEEESAPVEPEPIQPPEQELTPEPKAEPTPEPKEFNVDDFVVSDPMTVISDSIDRAEEYDEIYEAEPVSLEQDEVETETDSDEIEEVENVQLEKIEEDYSTVEELEEPEETMPFSFTQLAANNSSISELASEMPDTIVQNSDGTFCIANKDYSSNGNIDPEFKKLVDSVLR